MLTTAHGQQPSATQSAIATAAHDRHLHPARPAAAAAVVGGSSPDQRPRLGTGTAPPLRHCAATAAAVVVARSSSNQRLRLGGTAAAAAASRCCSCFRLQLIVQQQKGHSGSGAHAASSGSEPETGG
jgi:hypothetical protein